MLLVGRVESRLSGIWQQLEEILVVLTDTVIYTVRVSRVDITEAKLQTKRYCRRGPCNFELELQPFHSC